MRVSDWSSDVCSSDLALEELVGLEGGLHPLVVEDVAGKQRELELLDDLVHALGAVGELPVRGHGVDAEGVHHLHHVGARRRVGGVAALPGVAAVEKQRLVRALAAHRSEEHTSELQSLMRISYAVFCLKKKT